MKKLFKFTYGDFHEGPVFPIVSKGWESVEAAKAHIAELREEGWEGFSEIQEYEGPALKLTANENALLHCLLEEYTANGGKFASPDTELFFRQRFCEYEATVADIFSRLIAQKLTAAHS